MEMNPYKPILQSISELQKSIKIDQFLDTFSKIKSKLIFSTEILSNKANQFI